MTLIDDYVHDVLARLPVARKDRDRIESDLRSHLNESVAAGDTEEQAVGRMGPPAEVAAELMGTLTPLYGPPASRFGAMLFDCVLVYGTMAILMLLLTTYLADGRADIQWHGFTPFIKFTTNFAISESSDPNLLFLIPVMITISMLPLAYFVLSEWLTGSTIGKWLFGLTIIDDKGQSPSFVKALVRRLSIFFGPAFVLDGATLLLTEKKQRASELLARTVVLRVPEGLSPAVGWMGLASVMAIVATVGIIAYSRFMAMIL